MTQVTILGAGFGGIATTVELRGLLSPEDSITLIDRSDSFMMGLRKLWGLVGIDSFDAGARRLTDLTRLGIEFVQADVEKIDAAGRQIQTSRGQYGGDYVVVALGAESRPDLVEGLAEYGHNVWKASEVPAAAEKLQALSSGRILILVAGAPYPCPPAPYECAMLIDEHLREQGKREAIEVAVTTIQPMLMPNAGREGSDWIAGQLAARDISFQTGKRITRVTEGSVVFEDGTQDFDMLIAVPPHRPPRVIAESGLTGESGWVTVNAGTLETDVAGVYALGDATQIRLANGLPLPKAGVIAELEGLRVARAIASQVRGEAPAADFDGHGFCFIELGAEHVARVEGDFYAQPEPRVDIVLPSDGGVHPKRVFEAERLEKWFGW